MIESARTSERLWRVRKDHAWIDAQIRDEGDDAGFDVMFLYDGECMVTRRYATREIAVAEANRTLGELQRAGWTTHW